MNPDNENDLNMNYFQDDTDKKTRKEQVLDENFKLLEDRKKSIFNDADKKPKKPFLKSGILLLVISVICIILTLYVPWAYIECDSAFDNTKNSDLIYRNHGVEDFDYDNKSQEILNIFEPNNCSDTTCNYIGLNFNDFGSTPTLTLYGFIILAIIGLVFLIFQILDRIYNYSEDKFTLFQTIIAGATVITSFFIFMLMIKFIAVYFMLYYNHSFIPQENIGYFSPLAIIFIFVLIGIIKVSFSIMKINYTELEKKLISETNKNPFFIYKGGQEP